jgi:hypothetical protein
MIAATIQFKLMNPLSDKLMKLKTENETIVDQSKQDLPYEVHHQVHPPH